ncbi:MAG: hypothetical protein U0172_12355 [Nitrospiraceae bacterium]
MRRVSCALAVLGLTFVLTSPHPAGAQPPSAVSSSPEIDALTGEPAESPDLWSLIETFVKKTSAGSREHFWVVNYATVEEDEVTVDISTVVRWTGDTAPQAERFLLLIARGQVVGAQRIAVTGDADCKPEDV